MCHSRDALRDRHLSSRKGTSRPKFRLLSSDALMYTAATLGRCFVSEEHKPKGQFLDTGLKSGRNGFCFFSWSRGLLNSILACYLLTLIDPSIKIERNIRLYKHLFGLWSFGLMTKEKKQRQLTRITQTLFTSENICIYTRTYFIF